MIININDDEFENEVENCKTLVLVDFWADWCGPCKQLLPILEEVSDENKEKLKIVKINIDDNPETPSSLGVRGIPTMMLFKDGKNIDTKVGSIPKSNINEWLKPYLNS